MPRQFHTWFCWLLAVGVWSLGAVGGAVLASIFGVSTAWAGPQVPREIPSESGVQEPKTFDFELLECRGGRYRLADLGSGPIVVAFLGVECPLAQFYSLRLAELATEFADRSVTFVAIDSNAQDSLEEMAAFAQRQNWPGKFLKDADGAVARRWGATRTPEVFLLSSDRQLLYQGRVDDQYGIGYQRKQPEQQELRWALEQCLRGETVKVTRSAAVGCLIGRPPTAEIATNLTYWQDIRPILQSHCVRCHRAEQIGPFSLEQYADVAAWGEMIREVVAENRMPPWHASPEHGEFLNDCSLPSDHKTALLTWLDAGVPEGVVPPTTAPETAGFVSGWQLSREPDFTCSITPDPIPIPATGDVQYQYFVVDPKFAEDRWIKMAELRPGNLGVVHHILCFIAPPGARELEQELDGYLVGYVPGMLPPELPTGYAKKLPARHKLVFQVHYTPNGRPETDQSELGLIFANPDEVTHEVITTCAVNPRLKIPPRTANHPVRAWNRFPLQDWEILSLMPHMHLRGQSFRYTAVYPNGQREVLLDVPRYDFNWQTAYQLKQPKRIEAGTKIFCEAKFDNSANNLSNPDPNREVRWGDQTWEEMMIGYFDVAIPRAEAAEIADKMRGR